MGYRHASIPVAEATIASLARACFFRTAGELQSFDPAEFDVVMFVNTTGELPLPDRDALVRWVREGGAFIGVHSASDTFHEFTDYLDMLGGEFDFHREEHTAAIVVEDRSHPSTATLTTPPALFEEYYHLKRFDAARVHVLLTAHDDDGVLPMSWWRSEGRGRVFYTALGHRDDVWKSEWFRQHLAGALAWACDHALPCSGTT